MVKAMPMTIWFMPSQMQRSAIRTATSAPAIPPARKPSQKESE
jgi:hypothetical protein